VADHGEVKPPAQQRLFDRCQMLQTALVVASVRHHRQGGDAAGGQGEGQPYRVIPGAQEPFEGRGSHQGGHRTGARRPIREDGAKGNGGGPHPGLQAQHPFVQHPTAPGQLRPLVLQDQLEEAAPPSGPFPDAHALFDEDRAVVFATRPLRDGEVSPLRRR
jgi:hypothetical protein